MRYPDHILEEIRARLPVSQVVGRKVALKKAGREYKGLSPFKTERSPSFFVNDQKGFYHCFASGEHGDIFSFVMKTEGLSFTEAIEQLAAEAGVQLPKSSPRDAAVEDKRARLHALLDASASFFEAQLRAQAGTEARRYVLEKRQLKRETIAQFRIGYAPNSRSALKEHLAAKGYTLDEMATSGMLIAGQDIREPYDRFRNRVMFPISDLKGRVIAFGGRALDAATPAKYLNSPETPLFHKGNILFNAARARPLAFERERILVAEGYMDVVALTEAGFGEAVAPLGTALTEEQIQLLWRMNPEPTLCFDGDSAGRKAAFRAVDVVLPHLKPGFSLSFAFLPDGLDPDDLVRQRGPDAMRVLIEAKKPLADVLFEKEAATGDWSTPERRAGLEKLIGAQLKRIGDAGVRGHYGDAMRQRLNALWGRPQSTAASAAGGPAFSPPVTEASPSSSVGPDWERDDDWGSRFASDGTPAPSSRAKPAYETSARKSAWTGAQKPAPKFGQMPRPAGKAGGRSNGRGGTGGRRGGWTDQPDSRTARSPSLIATLVKQDANPLTRETLIVTTVVMHPWLLEDHAETFAAVELRSADLQRLRDAVLTVLARAQEGTQDQGGDLDSAQLTTQLARLGVASRLTLIDRCVTHRSDKFAASSADRPTVEAGWMDAIRLHRRKSELVRALALAEAAFIETQGDDDLERIRELHRELATASEPDFGPPL